MHRLILLLVLFTAPAGAERQEAARFSNGPVELAGTIVRPDADGPYPGVVFVHGSGPHTRGGPVSYASAFTDAGVGLLAFDKRGTGESGGSWVTSSLDDLADDVCAAVRYLRTQSGFDPERIGLWGVSQGGWIAPLVALRCPPIAFMIVVSGGGASPIQSELYSYRRAMQGAGIAASEQARIMALLGDYFWYLGTGRDRDRLMAHMERVRDADWYDHLGLETILPSDENRPNWAWVANFDPLPSISRYQGPVLLVFGDQDQDQPTELAIERWTQALALAGNENFEIRVFEGANHGMRMSDAPHEHGSRPPFAEGYPALLGEWVAGLYEER